MCATNTLLNYQFYSTAHAHRARTRKWDEYTSTSFIRSFADSMWIQWSPYRFVYDDFFFTERVNSKRSALIRKCWPTLEANTNSLCGCVYLWRSRQWWMYAVQLWSWVVSEHTMLNAPLLIRDTRHFNTHNVVWQKKRQIKEHSVVATELLCLSLLYYILWTDCFPQCQHLPDKNLLD